ncbi:DUF799 domain-containing protein [Phocoenobacter skyensis]|uniref:DUF799 domain-containing protein n=1 Tax=Phocoenobacter skyensis TaxID=97481 RepID=A0A1H7XPH4_9PAST|nr:DUF799 domain-containing protein [Pasteurella skyensis]MDP8080094.1 DUF799 domain-containing protein [Pasteurella skyensis]MDP8086058.1 DUF799 domain-containing protein [Pasteurella skyensis]MDP8162421.1 DUF799 domain-containing protein [Pasteurella skyensis]MDP8169691.1 DUF799 domain-containing protein [Pasteurella skyensis]MDP8172245.1 DUF799 domain-containing protein [Pasteurella skyensis]
MKKLSLWLASLSIILLSGCSNTSKPYDYSALQNSSPKSILLVLPKNNSPEVKADIAVLAQSTVPLAEKGYYVFPVTLVNELFKENGVTNGNDIQNVSAKKLHQIFGADAAMYMTVDEYGSSYKVFDSVTTVSATANLVDLKSGKSLWSGNAKVATSSNGDQSNNIFGVLISAMVNQIINSVTDQGYKVAGQTTAQLFNAGHSGNILYGPKHPLYQKDPQLQAK